MISIAESNGRAALRDPAGLFNSSLEGGARRAIDFRAGQGINEEALKALIRSAVALNASRACEARQISTSVTELLINIDVPDLEAAERFYTAAFGLRAARRFGADALELTGWPVHVYLLSKPPGEIGAGNDLRRYGRHWTPIHPDIVVQRLDHAVQKALAAGAILDHPPRATPYGRIAMMADPFGHGFCLIEFNTRGYDALTGPAPSDEIP